MKTMKRNVVLLWALALLLPLTVEAAAFLLFPFTEEVASANLSIDQTFDIKAGEERELVINLTNPDNEITLVQFDLRLPEGLSLKLESGEYVFDIAGRTTWRKHSLDVNATDGILRFLLASNSNTAITGTDGAIITMTLVADASFSNGDIRLENILLVSPDEQETRQSTYVFHVGETPEVPHPSTGTAKLSIEPFSILSGHEQEIIIDLTNPDDEITLVQFDLCLPEGLSLKTENGEYVFDMAGRTTWKKHSLDANVQADGSIRFLLASNSNSVITGTEGPLITMTIVATDAYRQGSSIRLENILLVCPDETEIKLDDVLYPNVQLKGDVNGDGKVDVADIAAIISIMANNNDKDRKVWIYGKDSVAEPPFQPGAWDASAMRFSSTEGAHLPTIPDEVYFGLKTLIFDISDVSADFDLKVMNGWWSNTYYDHVKWTSGLNELQITEEMAKECAKGGEGKDLDLMLYSGTCTINAVYYEE